MKYKLECLDCKSVFWAKGSFDPETNATEINEANCPNCGSDGYEIIGEEDDYAPDFNE